jgi:hypothetical protein
VQVVSRNGFSAVQSMAKHVYVGLAKTIYIYTIYDRIFGEFPAKNAIYGIYTLYMCGSG